MKFTRKALDNIGQALSLEVLFAKREDEEHDYARRVGTMLNFLALEDPTIDESAFIDACYPFRLRDWKRPPAVYRAQVRDNSEAWWSHRRRFVTKHAAIHYAQTKCKWWDRARVINNLGNVYWTKKRTRVTRRGAAA